MKVLKIYDRIWPYSIGGAERRFRSLAEGLANHGHDVVLVGQREWEYGPALKEEGNIRVLGISERVVEDKRTVMDGLRYARILRQRLPAWLDYLKPDIIDVANFPFFPLLAIRGELRRRRIPMVVTWSEFYDWKWWGDHVGWLKMPVARFIEQLTVNSGRAAITPSAMTTKRLRKAGCRLPIHQIAHGLSIEELAAVQPNGHRADVIFPSRLTKAKKVDLLIEAIGHQRQRGRKYTCTIIGDGYMRPELQALADRVAPGQVEFTGWISDEELYSRIKSAKLMVHPSAQEGFGIVTIEAYACGLPVIAADWPYNATTTLVRHNSTGLIVPPTPAGVGDAIDYVLRTDGLHAFMSQQASAEAQNYRWEPLVAHLEEVYESILDKAALGPAIH